MVLRGASTAPDAMTINEGHAARKASITRFTVYSSLGSVLLSGFNFLSQSLIAATFGTTSELDNYYLALAMAMYFTNLVSRPVIEPLPGFYREKASEGLLNAIFSMVILLGASALVFLLFASGGLVHLFDGRLTPERVEKVSHIARFISLVPVTSGLLLLAEILFSIRKSFLLPKFLNLLTPLSVLAAVLFGARSMGAAAIALGLVVGNLAQGAVSLYFLGKSGYRLKFGFRFRGIGLKKYFGTSFPFFLTTALGGLIIMIDRSVALKIGAGSVSSLVMAESLMGTIIAILLLPFINVLYPYLAGAKDEADFEKLFLWLAKGALFVFVPLGVLIAFESHLLVHVLYERGKFLSADTSVVSGVLMAFMFGLPFVALTYIEGRGILIRRKVWPLVGLLPLSIGLRYTGDVWFGKWYGVMGIALSSTTGMVLFAAINLLVLFGISTRSGKMAMGLLGSFGMAVLATAPALAGAWGCTALLERVGIGNGFLSQLMSFLASITAFGMVYAGIMLKSGLAPGILGMLAKTRLSKQNG